jgi:beta-mannosidase
MTCGPYRPIILTTFTAHITDVHPRTSVTFNKEAGTYLPALKVDFDIDGASIPNLTTRIVLRNPQGGNVIRQEDVALGTVEKQLVKDAVVWKLESEEVKLWWPVGYGEQSLYDVEVILLGPVSRFCALDILALMHRWVYVLEWKDHGHAGQAFRIPHSRAYPRAAG